MSSAFARSSTYFFGDSTIPTSGNQSALTRGCDTLFMIFHKAEIQIIRHAHTERTRAPCSTFCSFKSEV